MNINRFICERCIMSILEIIVIGIGLSMDAFAVSVCKGVKMRPYSVKQSLIISLFFGGFQALMPLIGWLLGKQFEKYITEVDHWIAFGLLLFLGAKMIIESIKDKGEEEEEKERKFDVLELFLMAIATSIDALAVGITFAFLSVNVWEAISIIGALTLIICFSGTFIGYKFGTKFKKGAEIAGGAVLILVGLKILLEHLSVLP